MLFSSDSRDLFDQLTQQLARGSTVFEMQTAQKDTGTQEIKYQYIYFNYWYRVRVNRGKLNFSRNPRVFTQSQSLYYRNIFYQILIKSLLLVQLHFIRAAF